MVIHWFCKLNDINACFRQGKLISATARETDGVVFYEFQFENPLDLNLPRTGPKNNRPTYGVELYELCVYRGKLWSVKATVSLSHIITMTLQTFTNFTLIYFELFHQSNNVLFPAHEKTLRAALASFFPRL